MMAFSQPLTGLNTDYFTAFFWHIRQLEPGPAGLRQFNVNTLILLVFFRTTSLQEGAAADYS
jgi:hypothetical protein